MLRSPLRAVVLLASTVVPSFGAAEKTDVIAQQLQQIVTLRRRIAEIAEKQEKLGVAKGGQSLRAAVDHIDAQVRLAERKEALAGGHPALPQTEVDRLTKGDRIAALLRQMGDVCRKHTAVSGARYRAGLDTEVPVLLAQTADAEATIRLALRAEALRNRKAAPTTAN